MKNLNPALQIQVQQQQVEVQAENTTIGTDADANASAIVIKGSDLNALSDDPDELQNELQALAGPSAGPNGGQFTSTVSPVASFHLNPPSAKSASTRIPSPPSTTASATAASRFSPSPAPTSCMARAELIGNDSAFNSQNPILRRQD